MGLTCDPSNIGLLLRQKTKNVKYRRAIKVFIFCLQNIHLPYRIGLKIQTTTSKLIKSDFLGLFVITFHCLSTYFASGIFLLPRSFRNLSPTWR